MSARSIDGTIVNSTTHKLIRTGIATESGKFTKDPPSEIAPNAQGAFRIESNGIATGAIGSVTYRLDHVAGDVLFHFSDPFIGSNHYENSAPSGFGVDRSGGDGDNASITLTVH